jgi:hypothetical protein
VAVTQAGVRGLPQLVFGATFWDTSAVGQVIRSPDSALFCAGLAVAPPADE